MPLTIDVPGDVEAALRTRWNDLSLHVRQQLAIDGYQHRLLTLTQVRRLLGMETRWEAQGFLGENGVPVFDLDLAELSREETLQQSATPNC